MNDPIQEMIDSIEAVAMSTCELDPAAFKAWLDDSKDPRPGYGGLVGWFENIYDAVVNPDEGESDVPVS